LFVVEIYTVKLLEDNKGTQGMARYTVEEIEIIKRYATKHTKTDDESIARMMQESHFPDRPLQGLVNQIKKYRSPRLFSQHHLRGAGKPAIGDIVEGYQASRFDEYKNRNIKVLLWVTRVTSYGDIYGRILTKNRKIDLNQPYNDTVLDHKRGIRVLRKCVDYTEV
jgi:hypothetical protein